ncbi:MAG: DUF445 family protein [Muribaculaceae bacterium]|nr:DUF445 family protein [Muribaculaceae bacterium]
MYSFFIGPAVGAVIGYITNDIAIRMLFKPHRPYHIGGWRIPFTPGIIPKEKDRIAGAIGKAISDNLMNQDVLERTLMSEELLEKMREAFDKYIDTLRNDDESLEAFATNLFTEDEFAALRDNVTDEVSHMVSNSLADSKVGTAIAHMACEHVIEKTRYSLAGKLGADHLLELVTSPMEKLMASHINEVLREKAPAMVSQLVTDTATKFSDQSMKDIIGEHETQIEQLRESLINLYRYVITSRLPRILEAVNISNMVERRIQEMDMDEVESIILDVMHKELRAIVWLGALLGCIMGTITSIF